MTTQNVARDMDVIRRAFRDGRSATTAVVEHWSWCDVPNHVRRAGGPNAARPGRAPVLDAKVMDDGQANAGDNTFHEFAAWLARHDSLYRFGAVQTSVVRALLDLRADLTAHAHLAGRQSHRTATP
jgi:hypothetical protein